MYRITGTYKGNKELLDTADNKQEAQRLAGEYRAAFGSGWSITRDKE